MLDDELPIICLKYNNGLHYDPIVAGCLEHDLSDSEVYGPQCGAENGESEPGGPEYVFEGNDVITGLKAQEDSEGEPPRNLPLLIPQVGF